MYSYTMCKYCYIYSIAMDLYWCNKINKYTLNNMFKLKEVIKASE